MTVTNRKKRGDIRNSTSSCMSVASDLINKPNVSECDFSGPPDTPSCCINNFDDDYSSLVALPTPEDSTASWLDADDSYQAADFLDEATSIIHEEEGDFTDACHDRLRFEYEQWKRIPHLRIIGKRVDRSCVNKTENRQLSCQIMDNNSRTTADDERFDLLRDQVIKIITETLWRRVLDKTNICQRQSILESRRQNINSSGRIESALIVSCIMPTFRPPLELKSRSHISEMVNRNSGPMCRGQSNTKYNKKLWPKSNVNVLPPIDNHHRKPVDKTKRWFSAINTPGRNHALPRPVTSVTANVNTAIDLFFDISIDGKSIKNLKKKGYCSPS